MQTLFRVSSFVAAALLLLAPVSGLAAKTLFVSTEGAAGAPGTAGAPLASIQAALDRAGAGDTVRVRKGVYREYVVFKQGGRPGAPVVLEGEPGAILDGSLRGNFRWEPAPDIASGVYRLRVDRPIFTVTAEGRIVTMLRESISTPGKAEKGTQWEWPGLFAHGVGPSGWEGVGALVIYLEGRKELLLRFKDDLDPNRLAITLGSRNKNDALIQIDGFDHCTIRGLVLRNAAAGIRVQHARNTLVENNVIGPTDFGVLLHEGAENAVVRQNEIFWAPYGGADPHRKGASDHWQAHKRAGWLDRYGVEIRDNLGGHEIHDNFIHDHWDGVSARPFGDRDRGLRVHHNRIDTLCDDGLETAGAQIDGQWYQNVISRCFVGIRIKAPTTGPLYIHHNILFDNREDLRNFGGSPDVRPAVVYCYQNTAVSAAAIVSNKVLGVGTPNYHFYNNLFYCGRWFLNAPQGGSLEPNWKGDYNVYVRKGSHPAWSEDRGLAARLGLDAHSFWFEGSPGFANLETKDFSLREDSVARGRGADLSSQFKTPLPGCPPGYFKGAGPDAGALAWGEAMPVLPRRPAQPRVEGQP